MILGYLLRNQNASKAYYRLRVLFLRALAIVVFGQPIYLHAIDISPTQEQQNALKKAKELAAQVEQLDKTLWSDEVEAQRHERVFIALWDRLRAAKQPLKELKSLQFNTFRLAKQAQSVDLVHQISLVQLNWQPNSAEQVLTKQAFDESLDKLSANTQLVQSEWHHSAFYPAKDGSPARSIVSMELHLMINGARAVIRGPLAIIWQTTKEPKIDEIILQNIEILTRSESRAFKKVLQFDSPRDVPDNVPITPMAVMDLDNNGFMDIIFPGINEVLWNKGAFNIEAKPLFDKNWAQLRAAQFADYTGDGIIDCIGIENNGPAVLHHGIGNGKFKDEVTRPWSEDLESPRAITSGDIDNDGDLDIFIGQYKSSYVDGQMPTPFYDANDGFPAFLFVNDGKGNFTDETQTRFFGLKRNRRSFTSSFIDIDYDNDLDLVVVSDFSGVDLYINNGKGKFSIATQNFFEQPKSFGMCHSFANFDGDSYFDFYMGGMSSTTARRLEGLGLERQDFPKHTEMREKMTYGNRLYQRKNGKRLLQTDLNTNAARAGWTWALATLDIENDGYDDIYVANGHMSGKSATDYCTRYWSHDIYLGDSQERKEIELLFGNEFIPKEYNGLYEGEISWNGYEHNRLYNNIEGQAFFETGFLFDIALEADGRAVIAEDLDNDGKKDLMVIYLNRDLSKETMSWRQELGIFKNEIPSKNNWVGFRLRGNNNHSPSGALVVIEGSFGKREKPVVTGDSLDAQNAFSAHFGLGQFDKVEKVSIIWPGGKRSTVSGPEINRYHSISVN